METFENREFPMYESDFWNLSKLAYEHTGIVLGEHKKNLLYSRLSRRIRRLGLQNFEQYTQVVASATGEEFDEFLNTITTNLTSFFREEHHFDYLINTIFPQWERSRTRKIRIWSAGCSTGEEPYSIAMTLAQHFKTQADIKILATDLDANVLAHGRAGRYELSRIEGIDKALIKKYFKHDKANSQAVVKDVLRNMIVYNRLNLLGRWPMKAPFDVIFCRNVLIYFDKETQMKLIERYVNQLGSRGYLIIGHSENITRLNDNLDFIGQTIYRKKT